MPAVGGRTSGKSLEQCSGVSRDVPDVSTALLLIVAIPGSCLAWHLWSSVRRVVECAAFLACMPIMHLIHLVLDARCAHHAGAAGASAAGVTPQTQAGPPGRAGRNDSERAAAAFVR